MVEENELEIKLSGNLKKDKKPSLSLHTFSDKAILFSDREDYDLIMKIYECGGWKWEDDELPTSYFLEDIDSAPCCVDMGVFEGENSGVFGYEHYKKYLERGYLLVSPKKFCELQGIDNAKIKEIERWFDKHKPNRKSKGEKLK